MAEGGAAPRIFISYRRDDSPGSAGRLYDRLAQEFPSDHLFIDVDAIAPGVDFVDEIARKVKSCDVLLVIIGRGWLTAVDKDGRRRLDNPEDFVRIEVETALRSDVRVIPVLVDGAAVPAAEALPENLKSLARRNAVELSHHRFAADARTLARALARNPEHAAPLTAVASMIATPVTPHRPPLSNLRVLGLSLTAFAIFSSGAIAGLFLAREGVDWWYLRVDPLVQLWVGANVMAGPAVAAKLWIPRLTVAQFWGIVGATFGALVAMFALQGGLQALFAAYLAAPSAAQIAPDNPESGIDMVVWMGLVEIPSSLGTGLVLGYFVAQALRGWFPDDGGRGFVRRMIVIWMATGTAYAVAIFLLIAVAEAAAVRSSGAESALAMRHAMRMWSDTVLFGMSWAMGWFLTMKFAGKRQGYRI